MPEPNAAAPATQDAGGQPQSQPAPQATPAAASEGAPFLQINDRTVYKTQEDAIKGVNELQQSYTKLTPWQEATQRWSKPVEEGGFGLSDVNPQIVETLLDELSRIRWEQAQKQAQPSGQGQPDVSKLSPEWQAYIKTLREQAGFATKEDLDAFKQQFSEQQWDAQVDSAIKEGESLLTQAAKEQGLSTDPEFLAELYGAIQSAVVKQSRDAKDNLKPGSPEDRFYRGNAAIRKGIIDEQVKRWAERFQGFAKTQNATQVNAKQQAMGSQPRPLPASGSGTPATSSKRPTEQERTATLRALLEGQQVPA